MTRYILVFCSMFLFAITTRYTSDLGWAADSESTLKPLFRMDPLNGYFFTMDEVKLPLALTKYEYNDLYGSDHLNVVVRMRHSQGPIVFEGTIPDDGDVEPIGRESRITQDFLIPIPKRGVYYLELNNSFDYTFGIEEIPEKFVLQAPLTLYDRQLTDRSTDLYFQAVAGDFNLTVRSDHTKNFDCTIYDSEDREVGRIPIREESQPVVVHLRVDQEQKGGFWRIHFPIQDCAITSDRIRYFSLAPSQLFNPDCKDTGELFLRSNHTAYVQPLKDILTIELAKYDFNLYPGADEMAIVLYELNGEPVRRVHVPDFDDTTVTHVRYSSYHRYDFPVTPGQIYQLDFVMDGVDFNYDFKAADARVMLRAGRIFLNDRWARLRLYFYAPEGGFSLDAVGIPPLPSYLQPMRLFTAQGSKVAELMVVEGEKMIEVPEAEVGQIWVLELRSQGIELRTSGISAFSVDPDLLFTLPTSRSDGSMITDTDNGAITDTTPPDTFIVGSPQWQDGKVTIRFGGTDLRTQAYKLQYLCELNDERVRSSGSETSYADLGSGRYTFQVQAMDEAGNLDPTPASVEFIVPGYRVTSWITGGIAALVLLIGGYLIYRNSRGKGPGTISKDSRTPNVTVSINSLLHWLDAMQNQLHRLRNQLPLITEATFLRTILGEQNMEDVQRTYQRIIELQEQLIGTLSGYRQIRTLSTGARWMVECINRAANVLHKLNTIIPELHQASEKDDQKAALSRMREIHLLIEPIITDNNPCTRALSDVELPDWLMGITETCEADVSVNADPLTVSTDPEALGHVIRNLLRNAVEAKASHIEITVTRQQNDVCIRIRDDGRGIAEPILQQLQSGESLTTKPRGGGIGLWDVRNVMNYLGARWTIESEGAGCGATVTLYLPGRT